MLDWLYPQTVEVIKSKYNGEIKVGKFRGKYSVWVGGFEQSGSVYVEKIWRKALSNLTIKGCGKVLVLGLGCGTVIPLVLKKCPKASIVGVDIDQVMIDLGKKYFDLNKYKNLKIVQADALQYTSVLKQKFDLIMVDIYQGEKKGELKVPQRLLARNGVIITNNLDSKKLINTIRFQR